MTDTTTISPNGRTATANKANLSAVGATGVVSYGGQLYSPWEYDKAWKGANRDRTILAMLNDPIIGAVLLGQEMLVRRVDWRVDAADDSPDAEAAAEFVRECLADMRGQWPGEPMARILTGLGWGYVVLEVVYKRRLGPDGVGPDGPQPSRFADGRRGWDRWVLLPQPTRWGWTFGPDGEAAVLIQQDPQTFTRIPVPLARCIHVRFGARDNSPEGATPLRVCYDAWYFKRNLQRFEAIGFERWLAGIPILRVPGADIAGNTEVYQAAVSIGTGIRQDSQATVVMASDRDEDGHLLQDISLMAPGGQAVPPTDPVIKRYANELVMAFLAQVMRAGQDGVGTFALGDVQSGLFQQAIGAHLDTIADAINEQAIIPLCRLNGIPVELAPRLNHGDIENADLAATGKYLTDLGVSGLLEDTPELRHFVHEVAGLPVPTVDDLTQRRAEREAMAQQIAGQTDTDIPPGAAEEPQDEPEGRRMSEQLYRLLGNGSDRTGSRVWNALRAHASRMRQGRYLDPVALGEMSDDDLWCVRGLGPAGVRHLRRVLGQGVEEEPARMTEARTFAVPRPPGTARVIVSDDDLDEAIAWLDELLGEEFAGLLDAKVG